MLKKISIITKAPQNTGGKIKKIYANFRRGYFSQNLFLSGPSQRIKNLLRGLTKRKYPFNFNPSLKEVSQLVHVLQSEIALRWALSAKQKGLIEYLIVGPNISAHPDEHRGIIKDRNIDIVINASSWVSEMFSYYAPSLEGRMREWFVGVDIDKWKPIVELSKRPIEILVYDKAYSAMWNGHLDKRHVNITEKIIDYLNQQGIIYRIIRYKFYNQKEYLQVLQKSKAMIFLSRQETQGQALFEAWACDVPTLVWDRKQWTYYQYKFSSASSAPYLNELSGYSFDDFSDFLEIFPKFFSFACQGKFLAREYVKNNFTIDISTERYLKIWLELLTKKS